MKNQPIDPKLQEHLSQFKNLEDFRVVVSLMSGVNGEISLETCFWWSYVHTDNKGVRKWYIATLQTQVKTFFVCLCINNPDMVLSKLQIISSFFWVKCPFPVVWQQHSLKLVFTD